MYDAVDILQSIPKVVHKSDIGPPMDFRELDAQTWTQKQVLREIRPNTLRVRPYPELKSKVTNKQEVKENVKPKVTKQKSIKNSFKTIISAAKVRK